MNSPSLVGAGVAEGVLDPPASPTPEPRDDADRMVWSLLHAMRGPFSALCMKQLTHLGQRIEENLSISMALQVFSLRCLDKEMVMLLAGALRVEFVKLCQDSRYFVQMKVVSLFLGTRGSEKLVGRFESLG